MNIFYSEDLLKNYLDPEKLDQYLAEVMQANRRFNLFSRMMGLGDLRLMVAESLIPLKSGWVDANAGPVLDIGSGWGVPAIPLLMTGLGLDLTLLERSQKKADFLLLLLHRLGLAAEVVASDLRDFQASRQYSLITLRGVSLNEKLRRKLREVSNPGADIIYFGSVDSDVVFDSPQSFDYIIDNRPVRQIIKWPIR